MSAPVVLALDFGGSKIAATVADVHGTRLATAVVPTVPRTGATANFDLGIATARQLLADAAPGRPLGAVGASSFGIPFDDRVELAPAIDGWEDLALGRELRAAFPGAPVAITNDVKAAAFAEVSDGALTGCDPGVYLNLGTGIAAAIVLGGEVMSGANGAAGEIGYSLRRPSDVGEPSPTILEDAVGGGALARRASAAGHPSDVALVDPGTTLLDGAVLDEVARELAMHLVNLTVLVDPVRIAVGGGMTGSWQVLGPRLAQALAAHTPYPPELVLARHPDEAPLVGALALALRAVGPGDVRPGHVPTRRPSNGHEPHRTAHDRHDRTAVGVPLGERNPS